MTTIVIFFFSNEGIVADNNVVMINFLFAAQAATGTCVG